MTTPFTVPTRSRRALGPRARALLLRGPIFLTGLLGIGCDSPADIDPTVLEQVVAELRSVEGMKSFLVEYRGELVAEEYFNGQTADSLHDVRSVTKSVTSTLIGMAIAEGRIGSVEDRMVDYLRDVAPDVDPSFSAVTIEDLLTMRAGHEWQQIPGPSEFPDWVAAPDQIAYILAKPLAHEPGTHFTYSDGAAHLAGVVLAEATGVGLAEYAAAHLWGPLGIPARPWHTDNRGYHYGGVGLQLRARDMLAFGALFLRGGRLGNRQIVPADWVEAATAPRVSTDDAIPFGPTYGYYWWSGSYGGRDFFYANGYGGQFIIVVPALEMVVVATCEWQRVGSAAGEHWYRIMATIVTELLPAVE